MNSKCAVVASHAPGATPYLIQNGYNGCIYESGNINQLINKTLSLAVSKNQVNELATNAHKTIVEEWNAKVAAQRFRNVVNHLMSKKEISELYSKGPCSLSEDLKNNWFH